MGFRSEPDFKTYVRFLCENRFEEIGMASTRQGRLRLPDTHWHQPCRGCRGHNVIPSDILVGGRQWEYPHQYYYVRSDIAAQY